MTKRAKKKNGFRVWHFFMFGTLCRQVGAHPMSPLTLEDWRTDLTLKQVFAR